MTGDATYTATFNATVNAYTITFLNYDYSGLQSTKVAYGETPEYMGETPVKPSSTTHNYFFDYWTPEIKPVTGEASYMAVFRAEAIVIPSSSSVEQSSSSVEVSSSSAEESSSSEEQSSSSETIVESSSSVEVSSSSAEESSNSEESSSSEEESSSSQESPCIAFVNGVGGYAEHCYNSGLNNMEAEKCYTLAPSRAGNLSWMSADASNSEWWVETSCYDFVPPSSSSTTVAELSSSSFTDPSDGIGSSSATAWVHNTSSAAGTDALTVGTLSLFKVSFVRNVLEIYVPGESMVRVQVFDMLGHAIQSFSDKVAGSRSFDLGRLPQGTYLVRVAGGSTVKTARVTVK